MNPSKADKDVSGLGLLENIKMRAQRGDMQTSLHNLIYRLVSDDLYFTLYEGVAHCVWENPVEPALRAA